MGRGLGHTEIHIHEMASTLRMPVLHVFGKRKMAVEPVVDLLAGSADFVSCIIDA